MKLPKEYAVFLPIKRDAEGKSTRFVQEWLCLHDCATTIDGAFGPATEAMVRRFQTKAKLHPSGVVDDDTMRALIAPAVRAVKDLATTAETFAQRVVSAARQHLREHPREIGGANAGPWVRLYTDGKEGRDWPWCAAFVTYLLQQATEGLKKGTSPIKGSASVDQLVAQAKDADVFVSEADIAGDATKLSELRPGAIFCIRSKTDPNDWIHCGVVTAFMPDYIETIEGNTNDSGDREGYEVCRRFRGYANTDFIKL
jgi:hypothetical protein